MDTLNIPLFPLQTVLFPEGPLPLRIFEPRYLDMVSQCMKTKSPFGVCLIRDGQEVGPVDAHSIGTLATIVDWNRLPDGLLGIVAEGGERFSIESTTTQPNQLLIARVVLIPEDPIVPIPEKHRMLVNLVRHVFEERQDMYGGMESRFNDAGWVSFRLAESLPLDTSFKQRLLEMSSPLERLAELQLIVNELADG